MDRIEFSVRLISRFGWVRAHELGLFLVPAPNANQGSRRTIARRVIEKLKTLKLVDTCLLPGGSEAWFLNRNGIELGKDLGELCFRNPNERIVSADWQHDCFVMQMLFAGSGGELDKFVTEFQILCIDGPNFRRPDGLVWINGEWFLVEVELSRKSGANMRRQCLRIADAVLYRADYSGLEISGAVVFYPTNLPGVTHRTRLVNALNDTDLASGNHRNLKLVGFPVSSLRYAIATLTQSVDGIALNACHVEDGLPAPIDTGQSRGRRHQYVEGEVQIERDDPYDQSFHFSLANLRADFDVVPDTDDVINVAMRIDGEEIASLQYQKPIPSQDAIRVVLQQVNRLRRNDDDGFIPPRTRF